MIRETHTNSKAEPEFPAQSADASHDETPTKADILDDIREGYLFVMRGGKGQPIDEMHRELADELASEAPAKPAEYVSDAP